jgi:hypothetical protein
VSDLARAAFSVVWRQGRDGSEVHVTEVKVSIGAVDEAEAIAAL